MADLRAVFDDLVRFETVLWNHIDARLRSECGVPLGSFNLLMVIDATPQCRVYDIAAALELTVGGTSQAVDRLEARGHCVRKPHPSDRRSSIVELTPTGQALLSRAGPVFDQQLEQFLRGPLSARALGQLAAALTTVRRAGRTVATDPS